MKVNLNVFQSPESPNKADQADLNIHELSSINVNDLNLNQSVLREALQNHDIVLNHQIPNTGDSNKHESKVDET